MRYDDFGDRVGAQGRGHWITGTVISTVHVHININQSSESQTSLVRFEIMQLRGADMATRQARLYRRRASAHSRLPTLWK